ncbi:MAG: hypothetical protein ACOX5R_14955 [bacterium]|jgi:hypothetical protein
MTGDSPSALFKRFMRCAMLNQEKDCETGFCKLQGLNREFIVELERMIVDDLLLSIREEQFPSRHIHLQKTRIQFHWETVPCSVSMEGILLPYQEENRCLFLPEKQEFSGVEQSEWVLQKNSLKWVRVFPDLDDPSPDSESILFDPLLAGYA